MPQPTLKPIPAVPMPASLQVKVADWPCDFMMLTVGKLFIRSTYQRELTKKSARTVIQIAKSFSWSKFGCLIVRQIDGEERYEVIDGQHRAIAAKMSGVNLVPAIVITDVAAEAFLGINSVRTSLTPLAIFKAELAAGGDDAVQISKIATAADVHIRNSPSSGPVPPGQTVAVSAIRTVLKVEGPRRLEWALRAIRLSEVDATPLDASRVTATNIRACAEAIRVIGEDWSGQRDTMLGHLARALKKHPADVLAGKLTEKKATTGEGVWKCMAAILIEEVQNHAG